MTDEEKAEEYAIKITDELRNKGYLTNEEIDQRYAGIVQGVLYGLAEARKESKYCVELLQNEKAELSEDFCKQLAELKEQVEDWKADHEHNLELMKGLNGKIAELEMQNEKMECCGNCSRNKLFIENGKLKREGNIVASFSSDTKINVCDKWELAE